MKNTVKAWWLSLMDADTEVEFYGGGEPFFGTEEELESLIETIERDGPNTYDCNVSVLFSDYRLEEIAHDIIKRRLHFLYILPESYDSLDVASDLFHIYDAWVDTDFCAQILPHIRTQMAEKKKNRDAELTARYGGIPSYCDANGMLSLRAA